MEETVLVVPVAKVNWQPMCYLFIVRCQVARFLNERLNRDIVEECFPILDQASPWNFGDIDSKTQLVLLIREFCVEAYQFFADDFIFIFNSFELLNRVLLVVKSRPKRQLAAVLARRTFKRVGILYCLLYLHLHLSLIC